MMTRFLLSFCFMYYIRAKYSRQVNDTTRISMDFQGEIKIRGLYPQSLTALIQWTLQLEDDRLF
jgi:hypothetical protein